MLIGKRILNKELKQTGTPVYSANVFDIFGYTDKVLLTDFNQESVVWGIDGDWNVNVLPKEYAFYPTDHCGVIRLKQDNIIEPKYLAYLLKIEGEKVKFSRTYRASIDRISQLSIIVPEYSKQKEVITKIKSIENQISELEDKLNDINNKKSNILLKHLN